MSRFSQLLLQHCAWVLLSLTAAPRVWAQPNTEADSASFKNAPPPQANPSADNRSAEFWGPRNTVVWSAFFYGGFNFEPLNLKAEHAFLPRLTAYFGLGGWSNRFNSSSDGWSGWIEVGARFFPGAQAPRGFFVQGFAYAMASNDITGHGIEGSPDGKRHLIVVHTQESNFGFGPAIGYTWIPWKRVVIQIGAGAAFTRMGVYQQQYREEELQQGVKPFRGEISRWILLPTAHASVGYAF